MWFFSHTASKIFSLPLTVNSFIMICLCVGPFGILLLGISWVSQMHRLLFNKNIVKFSTTISSNIIFSLSQLIWNPIACMLMCLYGISLRVFVPFSLCSLACMISICLSHSITCEYPIILASCIEETDFSPSSIFGSFVKY